MSDAAFFVAGGTVPPGAASYVERAADRELFEALVAGEFAYVLNSRQMGKSSLAVRTIARLNGAGVRTAFVDLTRLGATGADPERWYAGLLLELGRALGLRAEAMAYLKSHANVPPAGRLFGFLADAALGTPSPGQGQAPLVVFVDEVDATRTLPFGADDLFAGIRQAWNARATDPRYRGLTFCLMGAALPGDLIRDTRLTPFNVGRRIELRDFIPDEARPFAAGLLSVGGGQDGGAAAQALARVLHWTGGHPYLTQVLCAAVAEGGDVDALVRSRYLGARARDADTNLADVGARLLGTGDPNVTDEDRAAALALYARMLDGKPVPDDEANPAAARIKMSGVARVEGGLLKVRNRLYREAFGKAWVRDNTPGQELRRQRRAYWKGALRSAVLGTLVAATIAGLAVNAEISRREANRLRRVADADRKEALFQRDEAKAASDALSRSNAKLGAAYETQKSLSTAASAAALEAKAQRDEALRQKGHAQASAAEAARQRDRAKTSAAAERTQRDRADAQSSRLAKELYVANMGEIGRAWQDRQFDRVRELLAATKGPSAGWEWGYWSRRLGAAIRSLPNPGYLVSSGDGRHAVCADSAIQIVDLLTGQARDLRASEPYDSGRVVGFGVSTNGRWLVDRVAGRRLVLTEVATGATRPIGPFVGNLLLKGVSDDGTRFVEMDPADPLRCALRTTKDGSTLARATLKAGELALALSPDGRSLLVAGPTGEKAQTVREINLATGLSSATYSVEGPSEGSVLSGYTDAGRRVWYRTEGRFALFDRGASEPRVLLKDVPWNQTDQSASVSQDGSTALLIGNGGALAVDLAHGGSTRPVPIQRGVISPDGRQVFSQEARLTVYDLARLAPYQTEGAPDHAPDPFSPKTFLSRRDGARIRVETDTVRELDPRSHISYSSPRLLQATAASSTGRLLARFPASGSLPSPSRFHIDGWNLTLVGDGSADVLRLPDLRLVRRIEGVRRSTQSALFVPSTSADGRRTLYWNEERRLVLCQRQADGTDESLVLTPLSADVHNRSPRISPNGRWAILSRGGHKNEGRGTVIEVWDLDARTRIMPISSDLGQVEWTADGRGLLRAAPPHASGNGQVERYDLVRKTVRKLPVALRDGVVAMSLSADGTRLAYATAQGLWMVEASTGRELLQLDRFNSARLRAELRELCFRPDGRSLIAEMADGSYRVYRSDP